MCAFQATINQITSIFVMSYNLNGSLHVIFDFKFTVGKNIIMIPVPPAMFANRVHFSIFYTQLNPVHFFNNVFALQKINVSIKLRHASKINKLVFLTINSTLIYWENPLPIHNI